MCIKAEETPRFINKLRKFLNMDVMKKTFYCEYGKVKTEGKSLRIPEPLYIKALQLVKDNELKAIEFDQNMKDNHQKSAFKLQQFLTSMDEEDENGSNEDISKRLISLEKKINSILDILGQYLPPPNSTQ